ncbi:hypothetical protein ACFY12_08500 [Streptomyces sp. NPDC001339]|uniref:hypothetical protein n=1 Tax=Streptomyces sp. NPDC001339 TaxID=3364563 RepID=UPI0036C5DD6A
MGVALGLDAHTLAQQAGVYGLRTQGCTVAPPAEVRKMDAANLRWVPREEFVGYVEQLLEEIGVSAEGSALVHSFASAPLPVRYEEGGWAEELGDDQVLRDSDQGTDSGIRIVIALGLHGWDWWTAPGSRQRCQDGSGTWAIVAVPFRRTFTEGQFTIHPAIALTHQLTHGSQMHQGRFDPRIAKGVIQTWEPHHFSRHDMTVSEVEARGKRQQLRHLTLGAKQSRSEEEPLVLERTAASAALAHQYAAAVHGTAAAAEAERTAGARESVQRVSERTVAKPLKIFYQGPAHEYTQYSYEVTLWKSPEVLRRALQFQARTSETNIDESGNRAVRLLRKGKAKLGLGDPDKMVTTKVSKPNPAEKWLFFKPSGYELFCLADEDIAAPGRDIKHWEDRLPKGSRKLAGMKLLNTVIKVAAPVVGALSGAIVGTAVFPGLGTAGGAIAGATIVNDIAKPYVVATNPNLINAVDPAMRHATHVQEVIDERVKQFLAEENARPDLVDPTDWPATEQQAPAQPIPAQAARIAVRWKGAQAQGPVATVVGVPDFPGVGIVLDQDAATLAQAAGTYEQRTMGCTPVLEADRERLDDAAPGSPVPAHDFQQYIQELFAALKEGSPSATGLLQELGQTSPLPAHLVGSAGEKGGALADWQAELTPEDCGRQQLLSEDDKSASGFKVLIAAGRHSWDWWTAPGDAQCARDGSGTWSVVSVPYRRFFAEGPYPIHPAVLLGHQLAHVYQIHNGFLDLQEVSVQVEKIRRTTQAISEHMARGVHPCQQAGGCGLPFSIEHSRRVAALVWESWGRSSTRGRRAFPQDLQRTLKHVGFSERTVADELRVYSQRSYREKENDTQEIYLKSAVGDLTEILRELAKYEHPWEFRRYWTAWPADHEKYKLKKEGIAKSGITCVIRRDLLPKDSQAAAVYQRAIGPQAADYIEQGINSAVDAVAGAAVQEVLDTAFPIGAIGAATATSASALNQTHHLLHREVHHGPLSGTSTSGRGTQDRLSLRDVGPHQMVTFESDKEPPARMSGPSSVTYALHMMLRTAPARATSHAGSPSTASQRPGGELEQCAKSPGKGKARLLPR